MRQSNAPTKQSLDKALKILDKFATSATSMTIAEICEYLDITKSTAYSMLQSFMARDYIERDPETGKYSIGYRFYEYGMAYRYKFPFLHVASKSVQAFSRELNVRSTVCVLRGMDTVVQILTIDDNSSIPDMPWGYALPSYATASGKLLLSSKTKDEVSKWLEDAELIQFTPSTVTDKAALMEEIEQISKTNFCVSFGGYNPARTCISSPIMDISGRMIASVCFQLSHDDYKQREELLVRSLKMLTRTISADLGYNAYRQEPKD